jgi:hypothetical protein
MYTWSMVLILFYWKSLYSYNNNIELNCMCIVYEKEDPVFYLNGLKKQYNQFPLVNITLDISICLCLLGA